MPTIYPTQSDVQTALGNFLTAVLPTGVVVVTAQQNKVAEPTVPDFVVMTPIRFRRLETNIDSSGDCRIIGSISGTTLTVSEVTIGVLAIGAVLIGSGVVPNTMVKSQLSGSAGQGGNYVVSIAQNISQEVMSVGAQTYQQNAEITVQLDFHSADTSDAGDMAQTVSTLFRDDFAVQQFANQSPNFGVVPLYADDPRMVPFINEAQQWEWRWVLEAMLQVNQVVSIPQPYFDSAVVDLISVDEAYPP